MLKFLPKVRSLTSRMAGFTMIELLIVITILGILAVAVLSAINPLEQINRGRDTASRSDAEQLLNAVERYAAFQQSYPWDAVGATATGVTPMRVVNEAWVQTQGAATCPVVSLLGDLSIPSTNAKCAAPFVASDEVKPSYITKVLGPKMGASTAGVTALWLYKQDATVSTNIYVCFQPQSGAFKNEAKTRCGDANGANLPGDISSATKQEMCACWAATTTPCYSCLP